MKLLSILVLIVANSIFLRISEGGTYTVGGQCPQLISEEKLVEAREICKKEAESGNRTAMYNYGLMFARGYGVELNYSKANQWYLNAAEYGHAPAMFNLGHMYYHGKGVKKDLKKYLEWNTKAAELNYAPAYRNIATMYFSGDVLAKDNQLAMMNLKKAAILGDVPSMYNYGVYLVQGLVGDPNMEGIAWILAAYEFGFSQESMSIDELLKDFSKVEVKQFMDAKDKLHRVIKNNIIMLEKKHL